MNRSKLNLIAPRPPRLIGPLARLVALVAGSFALLGAAAAGDAATPEPERIARLVAVGERIYREGIGGDGKVIPAVGTGGFAVDARTAACATCHRRSGMGGTEGRIRALPITVRDLYTAPGASRPYAPGDYVGRVRTGAPPPIVEPRILRPAYDDALLDRSLREGVDPTGRRFDPIMPRYPELSSADLQALIAYLRTLQAEPPAGIDGDLIHVATIVAPDAPAPRRAALLEMARIWARQRKMALQVWTLDGPPSTWEAQLDAAYDRRPVFAVLSGAGGGHWAPVEAFCERRRLPCVFPLVDADADTLPGQHWSIYFTAGVPLEASILSAAIQEAEGDERPARVVQVADGVAGRAGALRLAAELGATSIPVETRPWFDEGEGVPPADLGLGPADGLVAWMPAAALPRLWATLAAQGERLPGRIYLSAQLVPFDAEIPAALQPRIRFVSVFTDPAAMKRRTTMGLLVWAARAEVGIVDERLQAEVFAALTLFGDAMVRMQGRNDREFLLEMIERGNYIRAATGPYLYLSFAADQRVGSKSGVLFRLDGPRRRLKATTPRITP